MRQTPIASLTTSVAVQIELFYGAELRGSERLWRAVRGFLGGIEILELTRDDAAAIAALSAELRRCGTPIGTMDTMIAGHALSRGFTLVTHNVRHFHGIDGLLVEDWGQ